MAGERALKYYTIEHSKEHSGTNLERGLERTLKSSLGEESMSEHIHATLMCSQYFFLIMRPWSGFHPIPQRVTGRGEGEGEDANQSQVDNRHTEHNRQMYIYFTLYSVCTHTIHCTVRSSYTE